MLKRSVSVKSTVDMLNDMLRCDRAATSDLFLNRRVYCNRRLLNHPTIQVNQSVERAPLGYQKLYSVGLLGVINGLFGVNKHGWGRIFIEVKDGVILRFGDNPKACNKGK